MWGAALMENSMEFLQKIQTRTTRWSSNSTSGYLSKENENTNLRNSLAVQWLGRVAFTAKGPGSIPGQGTRIPTSCSVWPKKKETKTRTWKDICTSMFIAALFIIAKIWNQPKCPLVDEWTKKIWYVYTVEYYSTVKKELNLTICNSVDGRGGHYAR